MSKKILVWLATTVLLISAWLTTAPRAEAQQATKVPRLTLSPDLLARANKVIR